MKNYVGIMAGNLLAEIWQRRTLIVVMAFNDLKLRYRNSFLGFLWSFLEPLLMLSVLYYVFTNIIKSGIQNYVLYLLLGLILWYMFSRSTSMGITSLVDKSAIIKKIYVRRQVVVLSSCLTAFLMMGLEFLAFGVFAGVYHFVPPTTAFLLPLLLVDLFVLAVGISLLLSVINVYFRDIQFIWQVLLQAGFFVSPIIYRLNMFSSSVNSILAVNPMVPIINTAHDLVLYNTLPSVYTILYIVGTTAAVFVIGNVVFLIKDKKLVDVL